MPNNRKPTRCVARPAFRASAPANRPMKPKSLNDLATKLEHEGMDILELGEFAIRSYQHAQAWKGACIGLITVAILCFLAALKGY